MNLPNDAKGIDGIVQTLRLVVAHLDK